MQFSCYISENNIHIQNSIVRLQANCDRASHRKGCEVKVTKIRYQTIKSISYKQPFYHFAKIKAISIILPPTYFLLSNAGFLSNFWCEAYTKDKGARRAKAKRAPTPTKQFNLEQVCFFFLFLIFAIFVPTPTKHFNLE